MRSRACRRGGKLWCMRQAPQLALERERVSDGYGSTGQPQHALIQAPYIAKNLLYYDSSERAAVALTDAEKAQLVQARCPACLRRPAQASYMLVLQWGQKQCLCTACQVTPAHDFKIMLCSQSVVTLFDARSTGLHA